ncbi:MAG: Rha family transcriptional regulator [Oceanicoccus sp.]
MNQLAQMQLSQVSGEPRVDSRVVAKFLGVEHKATFQLLNRYKDKLCRLGVLPFQMEKRPKGTAGGRAQKYTLLNEGQSYFLLTLSANTEQAVECKFNLVKAFDEMREALAAKADYLPCYRECHDNITRLVKLSGSSTPEPIHHMNVEKLINKAFGFPSGVRSKLPPSVRSAISVAEHIAGVQYRRAIDANENHKIAYQAAKIAVNNYAASVLDALPLLDRGEAA